ncbi:MAG TPA: peptidase M16 [Gammaproteobacteria bacterium]|nr:peptidase M16 [Gammaproteobacteria bacterium]
MLRKITLILLVLFATQAGASEPAKVHEHQLENGLKVLVQVDSRSPIVVQQVWYKVGSSYETGGITGISHVLEHMMFKGTERFKAGEFSEIIARNGGRENAFTGRDYTAYFQTVAKDRLPLVMEMEADRMQGLKLDEQEFVKEIEVVIEERRSRTDDKPRSKLFEQFSATAFLTDPKRNPVIGWRADLEALTLNDLQAWYQKWYAPNNATLVVVGDVDPQTVFQLAKKYYGPLKPMPVGQLKPRPEISQNGPRRLRLKIEAKLPYLLMGVKVPTVFDAVEPWEPYALSVLAAVLDGGESARFADRLVRDQQIANQAGAGYDMFDRGTGLFLFDGTPASGQTVKAVEEALLEQIALVQKEGVGEAELEKVKTNVVASDVYERDSVFYQAMKLGRLETVGLSYNTLDDYIDKIRSVTAEQVQAVAKKYFLDEKLTVAVLEPLGTHSHEEQGK